MRERQVEFAPEAIDDLQSLYDYIAGAAGPATAIAYLDRLEAWCAGFSVAAERGRQRDDIRTGLRIVGYQRRITVAFTTDPERVTILRLFYGGQDWEPKLR